MSIMDLWVLATQIDKLFRFINNISLKKNIFFNPLPFHSYFFIFLSTIYDQYPKIHQQFIIFLLLLILQIINILIIRIPNMHHNQPIPSHQCQEQQTMMKIMDFHIRVNDDDLQEDIKHPLTTFGIYIQNMRKEWGVEGKRLEHGQKQPKTNKIPIYSLSSSLPSNISLTSSHSSSSSFISSLSQPSPSSSQSSSSQSSSSSSQVSHSMSPKSNWRRQYHINNKGPFKSKKHQCKKLTNNQHYASVNTHNVIQVSQQSQVDVIQMTKNKTKQEIMQEKRRRKRKQQSHRKLERIRQNMRRKELERQKKREMEKINDQQVQKKEIQEKQKKKQRDRERQKQKREKKKNKNRSFSSPEQLSLIQKNRKGPDYPQITFRRLRELQDILIHHNQKNRIPPLMKEISLANSYSPVLTNPKSPLPMAPPLPIDFYSVEYYQQIFMKNLKNQLFHCIRERLKKLGPRIQVTFMSQVRKNQDLVEIKITGPGNSLLKIKQVASKYRAVLLCKKNDSLENSLQHPVQNPQSEEKKYYFCFHSENYTGKSDNSQIKLNLYCSQQIALQAPCPIYLYDLDKFTTQCRQWDALCNIKMHKLSQVLLDPCRNALKIAKPLKYTKYENLQALLQEKLRKKFNESQFQAIEGIAYQDSGILLLQGPPGTGKTSTLMGILACQLTKLGYFNMKAPSLCPKILVCAPSNAAADHIASKIIHQGLQTLQSEYGCNSSCELAPILRIGLIQDQCCLKKINMNSLIKWITQMQQNTHPHLTINHLRQECSILQKQLRVHQLSSNRNYGRQQQGKSMQQNSQPFLPLLQGNLQWTKNRKIDNKQQNNRSVSLDSQPNLSYHLTTFRQPLKFDVSKPSEGNKNDWSDIKESQIQDQEELTPIELTEIKMKIKILNKLVHKLTNPNPLSNIASKNGNQKAFIKQNIHFIEKELFADAQIIITTLTSSYSQKITSMNPTFSCLIVDEAGQATEPNLLIPFQLGINKVVLIGDPEQLPPTLLYKGSIHNKYNRSMFGRFLEGGVKPYFLNTQYRMSEIICEFANKMFYKSRLKTGEKRKNRKQNQIFKMILENTKIQKPSVIINGIRYGERQQKLKECMFINCERTSEKEVENSFMNEGQAEYINQLVVGLLVSIRKLQIRDKMQKISIGVITPYRSQQKVIKTKIRKICSKVKGCTIRNINTSNITLNISQLNQMSVNVSRTQNKYMQVDITISTVDSYQGQERDIILISTVRNNPTANVGFLSDRRRINVALTRAKYILAVIGCQKTLSTNSYWAQYCEWCGRRESKFDVKGRNEERMLRLDGK